jgi:excisionase family DNA binding protein
MPAPTAELGDQLAYRPTQAARIIGVSRARIDELIRAGQIRARKPSARVTLIPRAELERWLDAQPERETAAT